MKHQSSVHFCVFPPAAGIDFSPLVNQAITFPAGSTSLRTVSITIITIEDDIKESEETFTCTLADSPDPPAVTIGNPAQTVLVIQDDDG